MTDTNTCNMMNQAYEILKTMTIDQIKQAHDLADSKMSIKQTALFKHQCWFAVMKKKTGAWA